MVTALTVTFIARLIIDKKVIVLTKATPFIYPFKTFGGYYIYDVNTNQILSVERAVYDFLLEEQSGKSVPVVNREVGETIANLKRMGFLKEDRIGEILHPATATIESIVNDQFSHMSLQVTQGCNLRCKYCAYSGNYENRGHSQKEMSFEMAKQGIDFLIRHSAHSEDISLGFYGGEPLLAFDLIKRCMDYAQRMAEGKKIRFTMTVNGTLLTEEKVEALERYECQLLVSLDGPKEIHDKNRVFADQRGSFDTIMQNLKNIKEKYPSFYKKIRFNMVMDPENDLRCLNHFISDSDMLEQSSIILSTINQTYIKDIKTKGHEGSSIFIRYEFFKLFLKAVGRVFPEDSPNLFDIEYMRLKHRMHSWHRSRKQVPAKAHPGGPCIPGQKRIFMNVDGNFYPCERVSETSEMMKIGNVQTGFDMEKIKNLINIGKVTEEHCKNCWAFNYCTQCAAYADDLNSFSKEKRLLECENTKRSVENMFKNYCMLKELGHDFDKDAVKFTAFGNSAIGGEAI